MISGATGDPLEPWRRVFDQVDEGLIPTYRGSTPIVPSTVPAMHPGASTPASSPGASTDLLELVLFLLPFFL